MCLNLQEQRTDLLPKHPTLWAMLAQWSEQSQQEMVRHHATLQVSPSPVPVHRHSGWRVMPRSCSKASQGLRQWERTELQRLTLYLMEEVNWYFLHMCCRRYHTVYIAFHKACSHGVRNVSVTFFVVLTLLVQALKFIYHTLITVKVSLIYFSYCFFVCTSIIHFHSEWLSKYLGDHLWRVCETKVHMWHYKVYVFLKRHIYFGCQGAKLNEK